jgi:hypothetical protein
MTEAAAIIADVVAESKRRWQDEAQRKYDALAFIGGTPPANVNPSTGEIQADADAEAEDVAGDLWGALEVLAHIRQAAHARRVAPLALLGNVLARVAAFTPPSTCLPAFVGGRAPLSLYPATMSDTGGGKSSSARAGEDVLPGVPLGCIGPIGLGSGEGLADAYLDLVDIEEDDGKGGTRTVRRKRQTRYGALFILDEGRALADMASRNGATIISALLSAWTGGPLGQANASAETFRRLDAGTYTLGLITAWQPVKAAGLFDETDGGLPGRFLYLPGNDPHAPDIVPDWPGAIRWAPPPHHTLEGHTTPVPLTFPPEAAADVDAFNLCRLRGTLEVHPLDAHRMLHRLKVAGGIAVLDGRTREVNAADWELAEVLLRASDKVRAGVVEHLRTSNATRERHAAERAARRELVIADTVEHRAKVSGARSMARKAHTSSEALTRAELSRAASSRCKALASVDDMVAHAIAEGWLEADGDRYRAGRSKPA